MTRVGARILGVVLSLVACACAVGPNYKRPEISAPGEVRGETGPAQAASLADRAWWEIFNDETLQGLIDEVLKNGYDVRVAAARVEEARANAGIARSEFYPQIGYSAQWSRARESGFFAPGVGTLSLHDVNLGLSWELDLWGRIRRSSESALAQYLATEEARRGVLLSLVAETATDYFALRQLDLRLEIARRTQDAFQETYDLFNRRFEAGMASSLETASAEASLAVVAAVVPQLESQVVAQENAIDLLLGRKPGPIARGAVLNDQYLPPEVPAGLPSELLQRRPDLLEAEQQLVAANANVGVAMASFFPTISLTGAFGGISTDVSDLFASGKTWSIAAGLTGPLFQGLRLKNQYDARVAQWEGARALYEKAVTNAFTEVSSAVVAHQKLADAEKELTRAVAAFREAVTLSNQRYIAGFAGYLDVLQAEQNLFPAENALAQLRFTRLANFVQLYKALGGGWNLSDPTWVRSASTTSAAKESPESRSEPKKE
ncbi:MAG TPA: efflux transporter outer membrane subunit [Thermoanaerobaculia bacterium]|nr:efflux transporter outer membrane subunit [Thermoanaerobaculia bacterium]